VRIALRNDLKPLTMSSEVQVESVMTNSGLPQTLDPTAAPPNLPFKAPFSSALPSIVQAIESYIVASLQFCQGLLHSYELLATMRDQRDRFISNLLVDLMASHASKLAHEAELQTLILMSGDAGCLATVLASLDEYTIVVMRGSEEHAEEDLLLVARALTRRHSRITSSSGRAKSAGKRAGSSAELPAANNDDVMAVVTQSILKMQVCPVPAPVGRTQRLETPQILQQFHLWLLTSRQPRNGPYGRQAEGFTGAASAHLLPLQCIAVFTQWMSKKERCICTRFSKHANRFL
jgi:hypothetical protein